MLRKSSPLKHTNLKFLLSLPFFALSAGSQVANADAPTSAPAATNVAASTATVVADNADARVVQGTTLLTGNPLATKPVKTTGVTQVADFKPPVNYNEFVTYVQEHPLPRTFLQRLKDTGNAIIGFKDTSPRLYPNVERLEFTNQHLTPVGEDYFVQKVTGKSFNVVMGEFTTKINFGDESFQKENNIYAALAKNLSNATKSLGVAASNGTLRHKFTLISVLTNAAHALGFYDVKIKVTEGKRGKFGQCVNCKAPTPQEQSAAETDATKAAADKATKAAKAVPPATGVVNSSGGASRPGFVADPNFPVEHVASNEPAVLEFIVDIVPGKPIRANTISKVDLRGAGAGFSAFFNINNFLPRPGQALDTVAWDDAKSFLESTAESYGYFDHNLVKSQILVAKGKREFAWNLGFDTGQRYKVGNVVFAENRIIDSGLLANAVNLKSGDFYSDDSVSDSITNLRSLRFFDYVNVDVQPQSGKGRVDLTYTLNEAKPNTLDWSVGYDTQEGPRTKVAYERAFLNRYGGSAAVDFYLSKFTQEIGVTYKHPLYYSPVDNAFTASLRYSRNYHSDQLYYSQSIIHQLNYSHLPADGWTYSATITNRFDLWRYQEKDYRALLNYVTLQLARSSINSSFKLVGQSNAGIKTLTKDGVSFNSLEVSASRTVGFGKNYLKVGARLGRIWTDNFLQLAPSLRFYSGGQNSVRGYDYHSLSSWDPTKASTLPDSSNANESSSTADTANAVLNAGAAAAANAVNSNDASSGANAASSAAGSSNSAAGTGANSTSAAAGSNASGDVNSSNAAANDKLVYGIGATSRAEFTLEYQREIINNLRLAVFVDGGKSASEFDFKNLSYGAGVGARYYLPVGFASLDIAYPVGSAFKILKPKVYLGITTQF